MGREEQKPHCQLLLLFGFFLLIQATGNYEEMTGKQESMDHCAIWDFHGIE
jgi:hypothetical protein